MPESAVLQLPGVHHRVGWLPIYHTYPRDPLTLRVIPESQVSHTLMVSSASCLRPGPQMEGMVLDLQTARELQQLYEDWKEAQAEKIGLDINVTVLTIGNWPTYKVN